MIEWASGMPSGVAASPHSLEVWSSSLPACFKSRRLDEAWNPVGSGKGPAEPGQPDGAGLYPEGNDPHGAPLAQAGWRWSRFKQPGRHEMFRAVGRSACSPSAHPWRRWLGLFASQSWNKERAFHDPHWPALWPKVGRSWNAGVPMADRGHQGATLRVHAGKLGHRGNQRPVFPHNRRPHHRAWMGWAMKEPHSPRRDGRSGPCAPLRLSGGGGAEYLTRKHHPGAYSATTSTSKAARALFQPWPLFHGFLISNSTMLRQSAR